MWFIFGLIGLVVGAQLGHNLWVIGALVGGFAGWALRAPRSGAKGKELMSRADEAIAGTRQFTDKLVDRVARLEAEVALLKQSIRGVTPRDAVGGDVELSSAAVEPPLMPAAPEAAHASPPAQYAEEALQISGAARVSQDAMSAQTAEIGATDAGGASEASTGRDTAVSSATPALAIDSIDAKFNAVVRWFSGGNTVVRVGIVILFFGVAFLLKYAYEHTRVPIELRLAGVLAGGVALLGIGWRLRITRPGYALALQGGGVGVLYLTIFAAFRLYELLPPAVALGFMVLIAAAAAVLAVKQDALALAVLGVSGGFLAPLLASTGAGSHVMLFSYYLVLNLGIAVIAWHKAWRLLNLLGLVFTAFIGWLWGAQSYEPAHFASAEAFLLLHFTLYLAIPIFVARRQALELKHYVDGTLVFGVPLVAFGMQLGMLRDVEYGAAWSALGAAAIYFALASGTWRKSGDALRLLAESYIALCVAFATLAMPLAFEGRITSAIWALEGAAIVWVAVRQKRMLARAFGVFLQFAAGLAFYLDASLPFLVPAGGGAFAFDAGRTFASAPIAVLNSTYLAGLFIAAGGLFCSAYLSRQGKPILSQSGGESADLTLVAVLLGWGALWWTGSGLHEIRRFIDPEYYNHAALGFLTLSGLAFSLVSRRLDWPLARWLVYAIVPAMLIAVVADVGILAHPLAAYGWIAWPLALGLHLVARARHDAEHPRYAPILHALGLWIVTVVASWEVGWWLNHLVQGYAVWPLIAWAFVPALVLAGLSTAAVRARWPVSAQPAAYLALGAAPIAVYLVAWTLFANFTSDGNPAPLPYLPLLTPLDAAQFAVFVLVAYWLRVARSMGLLGALFAYPAWLYAVFGGAAFIWLNGVLLRTLHHWAGVPFKLDLMLRSVLVQTAFSIFWTVLALAAMAFATRRSLRALWIAGAALMTVVVAKLFLVDLSNIGGVERIVSFIGVGVLMLVIGYFAPVPPKAQAAAPEAL
jgi:uncharacterized membrane protein